MKIIFLGLCVALLAGCSSAKVLNTRSAAYTDFKAYKTFNFYKLESNIQDTLSTAYQTNIALVQSAVVNELQRRGYALAVDKPDLLLNLGIVVNEKAQPRETNFATDAPKYIGQRNYTWQSKEDTIGHYREGSVTLDVVDAAKRAIVWQGTVEDLIPKQESKIANAVKDGIHKLFDKFPVQP